MNAFSDPVIERDVRELQLGSPLTRMADSKMLITGASGMLMSYLAGLIWKIREVRGFQRGQLACASRSTQNNYPRDVLSLDYGSAVEWILEARPRIVVHGASPADPADFMQDPVACLDANVLLTRELALACSEVKASLVFVSSGEVYGVDPPVPTKEDMFGSLDPIAPRSVYAEAKRAAEAYVLAIGRATNLDFRVVRLFHTFGPGIDSHDTRIFADLVKAAASDKAFEMRSDGSKVRSLLYAFDAMNGIAFCLEHVPGLSATNVAGGQGYSVREIASLAMNAMAPKLEPNVVMIGGSDDAEFESRISRNIADNGKLLETGWHPQVTISDAFKRTYDSYLWRLGKT